MQSFGANKNKGAGTKMHKYLVGSLITNLGSLT